MEIENNIDPKTRLEQGIFFTKLHIVDKIIDSFKLTGVKHVIDSAAGSCNFLINLAKKNPDIQFYGIEKNKEIFTTVSKDIADITNINYFLGDVLLDSFPIPKCDLYLGNPPFINFSDLPAKYREEIKPLWLNYFPESKGFKMLLGDSRGDIAQLIFTHTIKTYLRDGGGIGVILPNSLIKGNSASAGFRKFNNIKVHALVDISRDNPFNNTDRNCFYILGKSGDKTTYPIKYSCDNKIINLIKSGDDLVEQGVSIIGESAYKARQGINTLGANSVFFFKKGVPFNSPLIMPLLKSSDINSFSYSPSYKVLLPYKDGKLIPEEILESDFPNAYKYLLENKETLDRRKSRFAQKCWYSLFGVGGYTLNRFKVVWRGLGAKKLFVAVTDGVIPNQAMNCYIATDSKIEADFICGIMNSTIYKTQLGKLNEEGAKSFAQPSTINKIFIPKFSKENNDHIAISDLASKLSTETDKKLLEQLDYAVESLYKKAGFLIDL